MRQPELNTTVSELLAVDEYATKWQYEVPVAEQIATSLNEQSNPWAQAQIATIHSSTELPLQNCPQLFVVASGMRQRYRHALQPVAVERTTDGRLVSELYMHGTTGMPELYHLVGSRAIATLLTPLKPAENMQLQVGQAATQQLWAMKLWVVGSDYMSEAKNQLYKRLGVSEFQRDTCVQDVYEPIEGTIMSCTGSDQAPQLKASSFYDRLTSVLTASQIEVRPLLPHAVQHTTQIFFYRAVQALTKSVVDAYTNHTLWDIIPKNVAEQELALRSIRDSFVAELGVAEINGFVQNGACLVSKQTISALLADGIFGNGTGIAKGSQNEFSHFWLSSSYAATLAASSLSSDLYWLRLDELRQDITESEKDEVRKAVEQYYMQQSEISFE